jgi:hypothetical protein
MPGAIEIFNPVREWTRIDTDQETETADGRRFTQMEILKNNRE